MSGYGGVRAPGSRADGRRGRPAQERLSVWMAANARHAPVARSRIVAEAKVHLGTFDLWAREQSAAGRLKAIRHADQMHYLWVDGPSVDPRSVGCPLCFAPRGENCRTRAGLSVSRTQQQHRARTALAAHAAQEITTTEATDPAAGQTPRRSQS